MAKYFTTKIDDQLHWPEFIKATDAKNLLSKLGREVGDYASDMQYLKLHLIPEEYKKLSARYRQFKHRRINNLVTFKVPITTIERITQYAFQLGYPQSGNPCLVDILHFLSDPVEMNEQQQNIELLSSNSTKSALNIS